MRIDEGIRRHGFRRWYERQLIEGHAYLVTAVFALIAVLLILETLDFERSIGGILGMVAIAGAGGAVCLFAFRQFSRLMFGAEFLAGQACCPKCAAYGRFRVIHAIDAPGALDGRAMTVRCRLCEAEWTIG